MMQQMLDFQHRRQQSVVIGALGGPADLSLRGSGGGSACGGPTTGIKSPKHSAQTTITPPQSPTSRPPSPPLRRSHLRELHTSPPRPSTDSRRQGLRPLLLPRISSWTENDVNTYLNQAPPPAATPTTSNSTSTTTSNTPAWTPFGHKPRRSSTLRYSSASSLASHTSSSSVSCSVAGDLTVMAEQPEEDFKSLPLPDRFAHKNWKVRKDAYEDAAKEFDNAQTEADPVVRQFVNDSSLWKAAVTDSNVAAHQEALACLCSFLNIAGPQGATRTRGVTVTPLAEKGLISTKPAAKAKALEAILLYVELDKPDPIFEELLPLLSHKLAKVVAATLSCFTSIFHEFGTKTADPKPVLKALVKVYGHADKNVRAEGQKLTVELYRWLREGMKPLFWNDLKDIQQKDLEALFEPVKSEPAPKQERLLRSQQAKAERQAASGPAPDQDVGDGDEPEADFEPELLAINVFEKVPKDFQERISSSKWKDRKEACDDLLVVVNVPAIEPGPFDDIVRPLAKCMKDANIAVVTVAANCIEALAKGLRKDFSKYKSTVFEPMMDRLKERKPAVIEALAAGLHAVISATSLADNLENLLAYTANKNPQVKLEATRLMTRFLKSSKTAPSIPETKQISDAATKTLTDAQEITRTAGAELLGVLLKIMGDRIMNVHLDSLDDIRKAKIKEFSDAAEVNSKYRPKAAAAPKPPPVTLSSAKKPPARKPVLGAKRPAAPPPRAESPTPAPIEPPVKAAPGLRGLPRPGAPGSAIGKGIRPTGLIGPSKKLPPPSTASNPSSPRRPARLPTPTEDEPPLPPAAAPAKQFGLGRGLTGRPLSKALASPVEATPPPPPPPAVPAFDAAKEAELEELRLEVERLKNSNEQLRSEQMKLSSQVNELQNQNAQLIEDHTRDVLSIKAKETQLVRARSEAESAEQTSSQLQREVERLKRELGRIGRANSPRPDSLAASANDIFPDGNSSGSRPPSQQRITAPMSPNGREGKENIASFESKRLSPPPSRPVSFMPPPIARKNSNAAASPARPMSMMYRPQSRAPFAEGMRHNNEHNGSVAPSSHQDSDGRSSGASSSAGMASSAASHNGSNAAQPDHGVESWKRAAEVTQNLKARIELMKARQGHLQQRG